MHKLRIGVILILNFILLPLLCTQAFSYSPKIVQISAAGQDCLALADDGSVWEWGSNWRGELTGNSSDGHQAPIRVPITNVVAISAGGFQNLALKDDDTVWAWGASYDGNLGNTLNGTNGTFMPIKIPISNVKEIYSGKAWSFAIKNDGTLWAWGANYNGQLGDGTYMYKSSPVQVLLTNISSIDANGIFAISENGDVCAWGDNVYLTWGDISFYGRLGNNLTNKSYPTPLKIDGLHGVSSISSGLVHVIVLLKNGSIMAWGGNDKGQLGNGNLLSDPGSYEKKPIIPNIYNVKAISAGFEDSSALKNDGTVWTWGLEENHSINPSPTQVSRLTNVISISAGDTHYMALKSDGTVWVFGSVGRGQAGKVTTEDYLYTPIQININFSSQAAPISSNIQNKSVTNNQTNASNQTIAGDTQLTTPSHNLIGTTEIRVLGVIGLIILLGSVVYLIKRK
jgi:alpha-tubulin suppressor-like RCC1 family protein